MAAYPLAEAARYVRLPPATLRSWVAGRAYPTREGTSRFPALIHPGDSKRKLLSFNNLIEAHVLRALRTEHGVSIKAVREAVRYAERELGIGRLLLSNELCTHAGELFLDRYGQSVHLSRSGQLAMRRLFEAHLKRVEWDASDFPRRLYPFVRGEAEDAPRLIVIDPTLAFGRPILESKGISTSTIAARLDAGESVADLVDDYGIEPKEVEEAVLYERAA
ncbi:MAG: DUF433 domain-containing protein [Longimicrobiaceae bacterium]